MTTTTAPSVGSSPTASSSAPCGLQPRSVASRAIRVTRGPRRTEVRAEQHQQRCAVAVGLGDGETTGTAVSRWPPPLAGSSPRSGSGAGTDQDRQPLRLECQRLLDLELVVRVVDELEALHEHPEHQRRLLQGELAPDAGPLSRPERPERVGGKGVPPLGGEVVGVELLRVGAPDLRQPVQHRGQGDDRLPGLEGAPATHRRRLPGLAGERGGGRPQPQCLVQDLPDVAELLDLGDRRGHRRVGTQHAVDLLVCARDDLGVLEQVGDGEGEQAAGGLVARDQERHALRDDVVVGQRVALLVGADEHVPQQVGFPGSPDALRSARISPTVSSMYLLSPNSFRWAPRRILTAIGSRRCRAWVSCSAPIIASMKGCWLSR